MQGKFFKYKWLAGVVVALAATAALFVLIVPPKEDRLPEPVPNAYDVFVRAGRTVEYDRNLLMLDDEMIFNRSVHTNQVNQAALADLRRGLKMECLAPDPSIQARWGFGVSSRSAIMDPGMILRAESAVARERGDLDYPIQCDLELIQLGHMMERGGG